MSNDTILRVQNLKKSFPVAASYFSSKNVLLKAVDGVNFELKRGETLGLVGESGCGKTSVGRCILRLYEPDEGRVWLEPQDDIVAEVEKLDAERIAISNEQPKEQKSPSTLKLPLIFQKDSSDNASKKIREKIKELKSKADILAAESDLLSMNKKLLREARRKIQLIFQDPWSSLNPYLLVKDIISEGPKEYDQYKGPSLEAWINELLDRVGLSRTVANRYPHEFSGGQRQRISIARALALTPQIVVCDEPVSALDVSIQAQILNLLISLQEDFDLTFLFIAHDLSVVEYISDRVAVMYLGKIIESAESSLLYKTPRHPYTQSLLSAIPIADPDQKAEEIILEGEVPSSINPPSGCSFHTRCRYKTEICMHTTPAIEVNKNEHALACHNPPNG